MAKKISIKTAAAGMHHLSLPSNHQTTFEFGQVRPTYYRWLDPKDKIKVNTSMLSLTAPMTFPAYGGARFVHRAFFVPARLISPDFKNYFESRKINVEGSLEEVYLPYFSLGSFLFDVFICNAQRDDSETDSILRFGNLKDSYGAVGCMQNSSSWDYIAPAVRNAVFSEIGQDELLSPWLENAFIKVKIKVKSIDGSGNLTGYSMSNSGDVQAFSSTDGVPAFDFCYCIKQGTNNFIACYAQIKPYGRFILKVMDSLGYNISFPFYDCVSQGSYPSGQGLPNVKFPVLVNGYDVNYNAIGLCSFLRVLMDNYLPSQFINASEFSQFFNYLNNPGNYVDDSTMDILQNGFSSTIFISMLRYAYQVRSNSHYFTDAWYNENSIISGQFTKSTLDRAGSFTIPSGRGVDTLVKQGDDGVFFGESTSTLANIRNFASATGHKWLQSIYNLFMRQNLAGSKLSDSILSMFGIKPEVARLQVSEYLGKKTNELQISQITQGATTETTVNGVTSQHTLGDYAGKGISVLSDNSKFEYNAQEWGLFIILTSLVSDGGYVQGIDRQNMLINSMDFYHSELEKTGNQPIAVGELLAPPSLSEFGNKETLPNQDTANYKPMNVFGFAPRYAWSKYGKDFLTGDYKIKHLGGTPSGELNCQHLFRLFRNPNVYYAPTYGIPNQDNIDSALMQINLNPVAQGEILFDNGQQYNRIFNVQDNQQDHFHAIMHFDVSLETTKLPIDASIDLDGFQEVEIAGTTNSMD